MRGPVLSQQRVMLPLASARSAQRVAQARSTISRNHELGPARERDLSGEHTEIKIPGQDFEQIMAPTRPLEVGRHLRRAPVIDSREMTSDEIHLASQPGKTSVLDAMTALAQRDQAYQALYGDGQGSGSLWDQIERPLLMTIRTLPASRASGAGLTSPTRSLDDRDAQVIPLPSREDTAQVRPPHACWQRIGAQGDTIGCAGAGEERDADQGAGAGKIDAVVGVHLHHGAMPTPIRQRPFSSKKGRCERGVWGPRAHRIRQFRCLYQRRRRGSALPGISC